MLTRERSCLNLLHDETLEIPLLTPAGEQVEKGQRAFGIHGLKETPLARPLAVVVPRRADALVVRHGIGAAHDPHPLRLGLGRWLD